MKTLILYLKELCQVVREMVYPQTYMHRKRLCVLVNAGSQLGPKQGPKQLISWIFHHLLIWEPFNTCIKLCCFQKYVKQECDTPSPLMSPFFLALEVLKTMIHELFPRQPPISLPTSLSLLVCLILSKKFNPHFSFISSFTGLLFFRKHFKNKHVNYNEGKQELKSLRNIGNDCS